MAVDYFQALNYTLANEDSTLEMNILPSTARHVMSIAGSGARVLPLLAKKAQVLSCVDISAEQLLLTHLRIETARQFDWHSFLGFWGYAQNHKSSELAVQDRRALWQQLNLPKDLSNFGQALFAQNNWRSILYNGKWERTFVKLSAINRFLIGSTSAQIFDCKNLAEQQYFYKHHFARWRFYLSIVLLGNATFFNSQLYKGQFPQKNIPLSFFNLYKQAFERLFNNGLARENYFLQLLFLGKIIFSEGNPIECQAVIFSKIKESLNRQKSPTTIFYDQGDVLELASQIAKTRGPIDFCSLSDVPSYFKGDLENNFLQKLRPNLAKKALVLVRFYLRLPSHLDCRGFNEVSEKYRAFIEQEKVQVYEVKVYEKK